MRLPRNMQTTAFLCCCIFCKTMGRTGRSRGRASPHPANGWHRVQRPQPKPTHTDASSSNGAQTATATLPHKRSQPSRPQRPPATTPTNPTKDRKAQWRRPPKPKTVLPHHPQIQRQKRNPHQNNLLYYQNVSFLTGRRFCRADGPSTCIIVKFCMPTDLFLPIANGAQRLS